MVNVILNERDNTVEIPYSCAGPEKIIKIKDTKDMLELILAIKDLTLLSGERICLETKDIHGIYTEHERW